MRKRAKRDSGSVAPSRTAAIGGTRVARSAGRRLAKSVTRMPTRSETTIVRVSKSRPLFGRVKPAASKSQKRSDASPRPRKSPITEAGMPTTSASITIEPSTWRREAPRVRTVANSRVRCAIVIESEFAITKLPTKRAMPANASRKPCRNVMNSFVSAASSLACSGPVCTCVFGGRTALMLRTSCSSVVSAGGGDRDLVELALLLEEPLCRRQVEAGEGGAADREIRVEADDAGDAQPLDRRLRPGRRSSRRS